MSSRMQQYNLRRGHQLSVGPKFFQSTKRVRCPRCNLEFSLMYSRAFACQGCRDAIFGCNLARCPKCDNEFPLEEVKVTSSKEGSKIIGNHMATMIAEYLNTFGERPAR